MTPILNALYQLAAKLRLRVTIKYVPKGERYRVSITVGRPDWMEPCFAKMFPAETPVEEAIEDVARLPFNYFTRVTQPQRYPDFHSAR